MELIFLGTSSALPTTKRNHSAIALKAFGEVMLFDCGEGTQRQMTRLKLSPMKINQIFITHLHGDHFLGLPGMIQSMAFRGRKNPLEVYGPEGIKKTVESIKNLGYYSLSFTINTHELSIANEDIVTETEEYIIKSCPMQHSIPNLAYSVEEKKSPKFHKDRAIALGLKPGPDYGKLQRGISVEVNGKMIKPEQVLGAERKGRKICYSGDTKPCQEMIHFASKSDVLIHESTFESAQEDKALKTGHSTTTHAAMIAKESEVSELILFHISTRYRDSDMLIKEAKEIFGNVSVAEDFKIFEVKKHD